MLYPWYCCTLLILQILFLQVHLREEVTKEQDIQKLGRAISEELVTLGEEVKASGSELEASLAQLDQYQSTIASLRQSILACEGELRTVSSPAYTARDRDKALAEQSVRTINHIFNQGNIIEMEN